MILESKNDEVGSPKGASDMAKHCPLRYLVYGLIHSIPKGGSNGREGLGGCCKRCM